MKNEQKILPFTVIVLAVNGDVNAVNQAILWEYVDTKMRNPASLATLPKILKNRCEVWHINTFKKVISLADGNGRVDRLLLNFELMKAGYLPINVKFADHRKYYDCFKEYHTNQNINEMILMVVDYIEEELNRFLSILF